MKKISFLLKSLLISISIHCVGYPVAKNKNRFIELGPEPKEVAHLAVALSATRDGRVVVGYIVDTQEQVKFSALWRDSKLRQENPQKGSVWVAITENGRYLAGNFDQTRVPFGIIQTPDASFHLGLGSRVQGLHFLKPTAVGEFSIKSPSYGTFIQASLWTVEKNSGREQMFHEFLPYPVTQDPTPNGVFSYADSLVEYLEQNEEALHPERWSSFSSALAISLDEKVVVGYANLLTRDHKTRDELAPIRACTWRKEEDRWQCSLLPYVRSLHNWSIARHITQWKSWQIIVGQSGVRAGNQVRGMACLWVNGVPKIIGGLNPQETSIAYWAARESREIVGTRGGKQGYLGNPVGGCAFIRDALAKVHDLKEWLTRKYGLGNVLKGWKLENAFWISPDGRVIVGDGLNRHRKRRGFAVILDRKTREKI
jgi:hypothetical protein